MPLNGLESWPKVPNQKKEEYIPPKGINSHLNRSQKVEEFEDAYTIATRQERILENSRTNPNQEIFIDKQGRAIPWKDLDGETNALLKRDLRDLVKEQEQNEILRLESEMDTPIGKTGAELRAERKKEDYSFQNGIISKRELFGDRVGRRKYEAELKRMTDDPDKKFAQTDKPGLYKDYNPKLNAGAPGNRLEKRRRTRKMHEEMNWNQ